MEAREAFLLIQACNSVEAFLTAGEQAALDSLDIFMPEIGESVQAFSYFAVSAASIAGGLLGDTALQVLDRLEKLEVELLPSMGLDWDAGLRLIRLVVDHSNEAIAATDAKMDIPTAINSTFSVALAAVTSLAASSQKSQEEWVSIIRTGAAREV